jgi:DNA-directed RNA polymerase specialized sigma subunit
MAKIKVSKENILEMEKEQIKSLFREGYSITEILEFVNLNYGKVFEFLKREGLVKKQNRMSLPDKEKAIIKLYNEGKTPYQIAAELKQSTSSVSAVLIRNNLNKKYYYGGKEFDTSNGMNHYRKEIAAKIKLDHEKGKSLIQAAEDYNVSITIVKHIISRERNKKTL